MHASKFWHWAFGGLIFINCLCASASCGDAEVGSGGMTSRMMMLAMQLGIILFAARIGNVIALKMRFPGVLGELAAGILIGPSLLGGMALPGFGHGVFPAFSIDFPVSPELYGFCSVASIVLLFIVGLETDVRLFMRYSIAGGVVGISGVFFSFAAGLLTGTLVLPHLFEGNFGMLSPACIFLGIMSTATSVGITSRILSEKKKLDTPEGVTILAGSVIDDVLGIIMLALGIGLVSASGDSGKLDWGYILATGGKAITIWLVATAAGMLAATRISLLLKLFRSRGHIALMALGIALIVSALFEEARLAMIIGAYVTGLSLSKTDIRNVIHENLRHIQDFMVPVFFTVMGMLVDVTILFSPKVLLFGLVYSLGAFLAKVFGCGIPAMACNFNFKGGMRIGAGMLPRGEVALIIAGIGLASGILDREIFASGIMMTLLTTVAAPPMLVALFKDPVSGLRRKTCEPTPSEISFLLPSAEIAALLSDKLCSIFEHDGFFVHSLSRENRVYQLLKDDVAIGFQQRGAEIVFDCPEKQMQFVGTAMIEVIAEFERIVRELRRPVDIRKITGNIPKPQKTERKSPLSGFLVEAAMIPRLKGTDKNGVIKELLASLDASGVIDDYKSAESAVFAREASMSTGLEAGVAIPHGRTDSVKRLVAAVGLKPEGVEFDSLDGKPTRIIVLALSPKSVAAPHMQFMAMMSNALDERGRKLLLESANVAQMMAALKS